MPTIELYDTTRYHGAQTEEISSSVMDTLRITECLGALNSHTVDRAVAGACSEVERVPLQGVSSVMK